MSETSHLTATSHDERRAMRGRRRRFEDQAATILQTHLSRLDIHRRSVTLFYLLFGLVVGFVLGVAGASGVLAAGTHDASMNAADVPPLVLVSGGAEGNALLVTDDTGTRSAGPAVRTVMNKSFFIPTDGGMEAIHLFPLSDGAAVGAVTSMVEQRLTGTPMKPLIMVLLAVIFVVTISLTATFWRHLTASYAPRRGSRKN
ncbi:MAG: hypothetical protein ACR2PM_04395 [Hyphomicrobiales bacterium]